MKTQIAIISLIVSFAFATSCQTKKTSVSKQITTGDNSQTSLDWDGTYTGILPCADCKCGIGQSRGTENKGRNNGNKQKTEPIVRITSDPSDVQACVRATESK